MRRFNGREVFKLDVQTGSGFDFFLKIQIRPFTKPWILIRSKHMEPNGSVNPDRRCHRGRSWQSKGNLQYFKHIRIHILLHVVPGSWNLNIRGHNCESGLLLWKSGILLDFYSSYKQGQTGRRTDVIVKLDKQKNLLKLRQTHLHTEKRADRKVMRKFAFWHKKCSAFCKFYVESCFPEVGVVSF